MAGAEESTTATAEAEMNIALSPGGWDPSFEFAFDAKNFSNRVLRVEVVASDGFESDGVARKRRRKEEGSLAPRCWMDFSYVFFSSKITIHLRCLG
jgi:hypothetical protein